ncbi:ssDNA-binding protein, mitochondrial [Botryosphaeria dothidea]
MNALRTSAFAAGRRAFSTTPRAQLAKMTIIGRLGAEPELYSSNGGREIVRYVLATNTGRRENNETSWFQVACFDEGPRKDFLLNLPKGTLMHLEADAKMNVYETPEGTKASRLSLVQRNIEVLSRPNRQEPSEASAATDSA